VRHALLLPLLLLACSGEPVPAEPVTLTIATLNDFHGALYEKPDRHDPARARGGLPWLAGAVDLLRAEDPDLILLDAGDSFQGSWPVNATQGMGSVRAFNLLGVDATVVGNHDFDYGGAEGQHPLRGALEAAAAASDYSWLLANAYDKQSGERWGAPGISPWTLIERKGVKVGVIGVITTSTPQTTLTKHVEDLEFRDPATAVLEVLPQVKEAGAQAVVVLAHVDGECSTRVEHDEPCTPDGELGALLEGLPPGSVDVVVSGHAHTVISHRIGDVLVVESASRGQAIGRVSLVVGPDGVDTEASAVHEPWWLDHDRVDPGCSGKPFPTEPLQVGDRTIEPDAEALALIAELEQTAGSLCDQVGCTQTPLTRSRDHESDVGNLVSDAVLAAFDDAHLAIQNSGGLRADVNSSTIRREHLQAVMPFDNRTFVVELTGEQVLEMFRIGSSGAHGILQVAGASYAFDPAVQELTDRNGDGQAEEWERDRLCGVRVGGEPVDPAATYRVVITDFLYNGGDHFGPVFSGAPIAEEGPLVRDALIDYVAQLDGCIGKDGPLVDAAHPRVTLGTCPAD